MSGLFVKMCRPAATRQDNSDALMLAFHGESPADVGVKLFKIFAADPMFAVFLIYFGSRFLTKKRGRKNVHRQSVDNFSAPFLGQKTAPKSVPLLWQS